MIDWPRVKELREEVGAEDFGEVVDLFIEEVEEVISKLSENVDLAQLEQDLHFLKGSALSLGFQAFSTLCQDGESKSAMGKADTVNVAAIISEFHTSKTTFINELPTRF